MTGVQTCALPICIVRDKELLVDITELYTKDFPHLERVDDYINGLRKDHILPLFATHAQMNATATNITNWADFLRLPETRIMVATLRSATNNVDACKRAIEHIEVIVKKIDADL